MVPGITDTECRIKQLHYRELHAAAERQRQAGTARAQNDRGGVVEMLQNRTTALMEQVSQLLQGMRTQEATEQAAAPGALALSE